MIKFMLNRQKSNNYGFFCPVSRMHLTVSSPVGFSSEVTPTILRALKSKTIIDVDNKVDLETGTVKKEEVQDKVIDFKETETFVEKPAKEKTEKSKPNKTNNKRGKRAENNLVEETDV